ncbi:MAG TPA: HAD-IA family hydrolase [Candidatus Saccharimonadales bacterium]|nr:HAD-IA family hydrolase [Candidatus Saccharimonadales bacterium]
MDEQGLGKRLQDARHTAGLTQQQLCHQANLSFSTLTKIERGAIKSPSIFTIQAIAGALGVGLDELVGVPAGRGLPGRHLRSTKSGAKFIYFDVNGCLVHFYQRAFAKLATDTGTRSDIVEAAFWHFNDDVCRGTLSLNDFNLELAKRLGVDSVNWQEYYMDIVEPITQMQELLEWAAQNYKVGLLTNTMPGFLSVMRRNKQLPNLPYDAVIDSSEVAAIKPEIKMYEIAAERAGYPPEEILLIDDSRANLMAAEKLGWHVLWFDDSRSEESAERAREVLEPAED